MQNLWLHEEETFLAALKEASFNLSRDYSRLYEKLKHTYGRFKIPSIVIGSISGTASFGTSTFPENYQRWVSIIVGVLNITLACVAAIESFMQVGNQMGASLQTANDLRTLFQDVEVELSLPVCDRESSGIVFVRGVYHRFQKILQTAPYVPMKKLTQDRLKNMSNSISQQLDPEFP